MKEVVDSEYTSFYEMGLDDRILKVCSGALHVVIGRFGLTKTSRDTGTPGRRRDTLTDY